MLKEDCDTLNITNIGKWKVQLKVVNDLFDKELDELIKLLMEEYEVSLKYNNKRYEQLRQRLVYIGNRD